jgi:alkaline phosphatase D
MQHRKFPAARVYQVTSSAISRKPAPKISLIGISSGGPMDGNKDVSCERLYALTGAKNFAMIRVRSLDQGNDAEVVVDLHWPGGEEGEVTKRRVVLG